MIYFARAGDDGPIKIGKSKNPIGRLAGLRTASAASVQLMAVMAGDEDEEEHIHKRFAADRLRGEWFRPSVELLSFISELEPCDCVRRKTVSEKRPPPPPVTPAELVAWRKSRGWTQRRASEWMSVSLKTYQNWEQGHRSMRHPVLVRKAIGKPRRETP